MRALVCILVFLSATVLADFFLECPPARSLSRNSAQNFPCGRGGPSSRGMNTMAPGPQTLIWREAVQHQGAAWRIELFDSVTNQNCTLLDHYPHNDQVDDNTIDPDDPNTHPRYKVTVNLPNWNCQNCSLHMTWIRNEGQTCRNPRDLPNNFNVNNNCDTMWYSCTDIVLTGAAVPDWNNCPSYANWPYLQGTLASNLYNRNGQRESASFNAYGYPLSATVNYTTPGGVCVAQGGSLATGASLGSVSVAVGILVYGLSTGDFNGACGAISCRQLFIDTFARVAQVQVQDVSIYNVISNTAFGGITGVIIQIEVATAQWFAPTQALRLERLALDQAGVGSPLAIALTAAQLVAGTNNVVLFVEPQISAVGEHIFNPPIPIENRIAAFIAAPAVLVILTIIMMSTGRAMNDRLMGVSGPSATKHFLLVALALMTFVFLGTAIAPGTYHWARLSSLRFGLWQRCPGDGSCQDPVDPIDAPGVETLIILRATTLLSALIAFPAMYQTFQLWTGKRPLAEASKIMKMVFAIVYLNIFNMAIFAGYYYDVLRSIYSQTLFPTYSITYGYSFVFVVVAWILGLPTIFFLYQLGLIGSGATPTKRGGGETKEGQPQSAPARAPAPAAANSTGTFANMGSYGAQPSVPAAYVAPPLAGNAGGSGSFRGPGGAPPPLAPRPAGVGHHSTPSAGRAPPPRPPAPHARAGSGGLPPNWAEQKSAKGEVYFYNSVTNESRWEKPTA